MPTLFSVIVPIYNVEPWLRACVGSVLAQTFRDFELILVDDGSPDGSPALCDQLAGEDDRITVIHQPNRGVVAARRTGLERASGEYICFLDGDDAVAPDWLENAAAHAVAHGCPDMLLFGLTFDRNGQREPFPLRAEPGFYDRTRMEAEIFPYMLCDLRAASFPTQQISGYMCGKMGKRALVAEHYITDDRITLFEDSAMLYECIYYASSVYVGAECGYYYQLRGDSALGSYRPQYFRMDRLCFDYLREHLGGKSPAIDRQINDFIAAKVVQAIYHEFAHGHSFSAALRHTRTELRETGIVRELRMNGLPFPYRINLLFLKLRMPWIPVLAAKLYTMIFPGSTAL